MAINSDFRRVFEIGPIFRAENCVSNRHLCEFTGMDREMAISRDYYEVVYMLWSTLVRTLNDIETKCGEQIHYIKSIHDFEDLIYPMEPLIIDFQDGVKLLNENGYKQGDLDDLSTRNEKMLGKLVKEKYGSDSFVLDKYPLSVRPFYNQSSSCHQVMKNTVTRMI